MTNLIDNPVDLISLVKFSEEIPQSATIVDGEGYCLSVFALRKGQNIPEYYTDHECCFHVLEGAITITTDVEKLINQGQILYVAKDIPRKLIATEDSRFLVIRL